MTRDELGKALGPILAKVKFSGRGAVANPPDAAQRVRQEIADCPDPARRRELEAVLADLEKE